MPVAFDLITAVHLPLAGFFLLLFFGRRMGRGAGIVATALVMASLGFSITALGKWAAKDTFNLSHYAEAMNYRWLGLAGPAAKSGDPSSSITIGYYIDSLTVAMFVMVTLIASLVHLFSIAWMSKERGNGRYFAFLNLFVFASLGEVLSNSLVQMLACWQVAGAASFMLIAFWFERRGPAMGALKSAIVGAVGDAAFLLALGILIAQAGAASLNLSVSPYETMVSIIRGAGPLSTNPYEYWASVAGLSFADLPAGGGFLGMHWLTWVGMLLFTGAAAKAAQFPLHVWMPDAMEAPAPVPALIHGSVFLALGVYLIARIYPILTPDVHLAIAIVGCITLLLGALLATVQMNLRNILAYAALSQAGFMMLFLGARGYTAALAHMLTQSFVLACLFLAAACVSYSLKGKQDIRQMGGLWRKLPLTALGCLIATLALIGVPFLSGAYSRSLGLAAVSEYATQISAISHGKAAMMLFYVPAATCFLTAFYMGRCWWLVFAGRSRNEDLAEGAHEPFVMVLPIGVLAVLSVNVYEVLLLPVLLNKSLASESLAIRTDRLTDATQALLMGKHGGYAYWGFAGAFLAVLIYYRGLSVAERLRRLPVLNLVHFWLRERMFIDSLYNGLLLRAVLVAAAIAAVLEKYLVQPAARLLLTSIRGVGSLCAAVDEHVIDGASRGLAWLAATATRSGTSSDSPGEASPPSTSNRPVKSGKVAP